MQAETNIPDTLEEVTAEVVSILAQGYMRYRKGRRLPSDSQDSEGNVAQVQETEAFTEKRLDVWGRRSLHSLTSYRPEITVREDHTQRVKREPRRFRMETTTYQEIQGLARMTVGELREKYLDVFGEETRSYHKEFLRKRIAWRIQVLAEGDLTERARRRAEDLADDADLRIRTPRDPVKSGSAEVRASTSISHISPSRDPRLPLPGTLLARDFKGRDIVVKVLDNGFELEGRRYKSLSAIDRLEGFRPGGSSLYRRVLVPILSRGAVSPVWLYVGTESTLIQSIPTGCSNW